MRETDRDRERKGEREREKERERERRRERETPCQTGRDSLRTGIGVANGLVTPMRVRRLSMQLVCSQRLLPLQHVLSPRFAVHEAVACAVSLHDIGSPCTCVDVPWIVIVWLSLQS